MRRRNAILLGGAAVLAAAALFMPLRFAMMLAAPDGLSAAQAQGSIWTGRLDHARLGGIDLGTLDVGVRPLSLLTGRVELGFARVAEAVAQPLTGSIATGLGGRGLSAVTGTIGTLDGGAFLPPARLEAQGFSARLSADGCTEASGRVRVVFATDIAGLSLRNGLSGDARCDGAALMIPLTGESGLERLTLRLWPDGRYTARLAVTATDPTLSTALATAGFAPSSEGFIRTIEGRY